MQKDNELYAIVARAIEKRSDSICLMCPDYKSPSKREVISECVEEILAYLKSQGIEKK